MADELFSRELQEYRGREIAEGAKVIRGLYSESFSPEFIKGAMAMLKRIVYLPVEMARTKEQKDQAQSLVYEALDAFDKKMIRAFLKGE